MHEGNPWVESYHHSCQQELQKCWKESILYNSTFLRDLASTEDGASIADLTLPERKQTGNLTSREVR